MNEYLIVPVDVPKRIGNKPILVRATDIDHARLRVIKDIMGYKPTPTFPTFYFIVYGAKNKDGERERIGTLMTHPPLTRKDKPYVTIHWMPANGVNFYDVSTDNGRLNGRL